MPINRPSIRTLDMLYTMLIVYNIIQKARSTVVTTIVRRCSDVSIQFEMKNFLEKFARSIGRRPICGPLGWNRMATLVQNAFWIVQFNLHFSKKWM